MDPDAGGFSKLLKTSLLSDRSQGSSRVRFGRPNNGFVKPGTLFAYEERPGTRDLGGGSQPRYCTRVKRVQDSAGLDVGMGSRAARSRWVRCGQGRATLANFDGANMGSSRHQGVSDHRPSDTPHPMPIRAAREVTRSAFWYLSATGATLTAVLAIVGTSMLSVGHLLGTVLLAIGLAGLASRHELALASWVPTRGVFALLSAWVGVGYAFRCGRIITPAASLWDLGVYADLLSNAATFGRYYSGPMQIHGLADHFNLALLLFVPLFKIAPSLLWLVGAKFICFLVTPLLLLQLGKVVLGWTPGSCLSFPACGSFTLPWPSFLFQFQATHLAPPLIVASFIPPSPAAGCCSQLTLLLTAALKEDLSLVAVSVGMFVIVEQRRVKLGTALIAAAIGTGLTIYFVIMPWFGEIEAPGTLAWFGPLGPLQLKALVVCVLVLSTGALALLHPRSLLYVLPAFGLHFVASEAQIFSFRLHYHVVPLTVLFVASLYGLRAIEQRGPVWRALTPQRQQWCLAAIVVWNAMWGSMACCRSTSARLFWPTAASRATIAELRRLRTQLPKDRELYVTTDFAAYHHPSAAASRVDCRRQRIARFETTTCSDGQHRANQGYLQGIPRGRHEPTQGPTSRRCFTRQPLGEHLLYLSINGAARRLPWHQSSDEHNSLVRNRRRRSCERHPRATPHRGSVGTAACFQSGPVP